MVAQFLILLDIMTVPDAFSFYSLGTDIVLPRSAAPELFSLNHPHAYPSNRETHSDWQECSFRLWPL
jgi:hypothetical protein